MNSAPANHTNAYQIGDRFISHSGVVFIVRQIARSGYYRFNVRHTCGAEFEGGRAFSPERVATLIETGTWEQVKPYNCGCGRCAIFGCKEN